MAYQFLCCSLCLLAIVICEAIDKPEYQYQYQYAFCYTGFYSPNSTYQNNLHTLLSNLTSNTEIDYGFYNITYGQNSDQVYATGLCRGDITTASCRNCLNDIGSFVLKKCPNQKEAVGLYDKCVLHYSYRSIFGYDSYEYTFERYYAPLETNITNWDKYSDVLTKLMQRLKVKASSNDSVPNRKFAAGKAVSVAQNETIYAVVQCSPDVTVAECNDCLNGAILDIPKYCDKKSDCALIKLSCNIRYQNSSFYQHTPDELTLQLQLSTQGSPFPTPSAAINSSHGNNNGAVIAIVVPTGAFVGLLIFTCIYFIMRKPTKHVDSEAKVINENEQDSSQLDFDTIRVATNNFSDANKLGQGGFGPVYKGIIYNEQEVAVKRLSTNSSQGEKEFKTEVLLMARLKHRNLVRLIGFSFERNERLLVYEFLPNKSLDKFLFDPFMRAHLDWKTRYKIIEGIARGLLYLHEDSQQRIIHRDLKASNILLDEEMKPKISDFGLAKLFDLDQTQAVTTKIAGTIGYMAPEYARHGKFSVKSDVFSYGVMILEIISGKRNSAFCDGGNVEHLISFAWSNWKKGTLDNIIDPNLHYALRSEIERCIHIGLLCVQERVSDRPTMASVVLMLESYSFSLPGPLQPAFFMKGFRSPNIQYSSECSSMAMGYEHKYNSAEASVNEASISSLYPR